MTRVPNQSDILLIRSDAQSDYLRHVKNFTLFLGRSPDQAQPEDLRRYQVHQRQQGVQPPTMNGAVAAVFLHEDLQPA